MKTKKIAVIASLVLFFGYSVYYQMFEAELYESRCGILYEKRIGNDRYGQAHYFFVVNYDGHLEESEVTVNTYMKKDLARRVCLEHTKAQSALHWITFFACVILVFAAFFCFIALLAFLITDALKN